MFGYVYANAEKLNSDEKELYHAYYCGLCKALKKFGQIKRLTLNFDLTFLALFLSSYFNENDGIIPGKCGFHPIKKCCFAENKFLDYAAKMNILLTYYKLDDDVRDDKSAFATVARNNLKSAAQTIIAEFDEKNKKIVGALNELNDLEQLGSHDFEKCASTFGTVMGTMFDVYENDEKLFDFGYSLGKVVYVMDACCDLKSDIKKQKFNPMVEIPSRDFQQILTIMLSETTEKYDIMNIQSNRGIIENILYSGIWNRYCQKEKK